MKNKIITTLASLYITFVCLAGAQEASQIESTIPLSGNETYTVPTGKYAVLQQFSSGSTGAQLVINDKLVVNGTEVFIGLPIFLAAGTKVKTVTGSHATIAVFSKFTGFPSVPINAVVIPENETGDFQVVLESSTDMVTWSTATAGTYTSSTTRRFFRVRVAQQ